MQEIHKKCLFCPALTFCPLIVDVYAVIAGTVLCAATFKSIPSLHGDQCPSSRRLSEDEDFHVQEEQVTRQRKLRTLVALAWYVQRFRVARQLEQ